MAQSYVRTQRLVDTVSTIKGEKKEQVLRLLVASLNDFQRVERLRRNCWMNAALTATTIT
jgi:hypothetical protein